MKMEKHAFLIGAYKNPDYLLRLVDSLDSDKSNIYIHVNKFNDAEFSGFKDLLKGRENIYYYSVFKIKWGGSDMIKSQLFLCDEALKDESNTYFHFITGQDVLCRPLDHFLNYVEKSESNFVSYSPLSPTEYDYRYAYYSLYDLINVRSSRFLKLLNSTLVKIQSLLHVRRKSLGFSELYWGSGWWSLRRDACKYVVAKWKNDINLQKRLRYTFAPDEMLFQNILLNSGENFPVVNDNLRYMKWDGSPSPLTLTINDYDDILQSGKYFARKIDPVISSSLIERIDSE